MEAFFSVPSHTSHTPIPRDPVVPSQKVGLGRVQVPSERVLGSLEYGSTATEPEVR